MFVNTTEIVKVCWLAPVVFPLCVARVFHVKISCPLQCFSFRSSFIVHLDYNKPNKQKLYVKFLPHTVSKNKMCLPSQLAYDEIRHQKQLCSDKIVCDVHI